MEDKKKEKKVPKIFESKFFSKLKSIKHFEIVVVVIALLVIILIFLSTYKPSDNFLGLGNKTDTDNNLSNNQTQNTTGLNTTEIKLTNLISNISGAGKVSVLAMEDNSTSEIKSVVVVASGAVNASVKLKIISIIKTATGLPADKIEVFY